MNEHVNNSSQKLRLYYFLLFGIILLKGCTYFVLITSFPSLQNNFGLNELQLGLIMGIFFLMSVISIYIWIYSFGKISYNLVILIGSLVWILGLIGFSFSTSFIEFFVWAAIIGFGIESSSVLILLLILQIMQQKDQGKIFSTYLAFQGLGSFLGVLLTAVFSDIANFPWNFIFVVLSICSLVWISILSLTIRSLSREKENIIPKLQNINFNLIKKTFKKRGNSTLILIFLYAYPCAFLYNLWLQKYFQDIHNLSQFEASLLFLTIHGIQFIGIMVGGFIFDLVHSKANYNKLYITSISLLVATPLLFIGFLIPWKKTSNSSSQNIFVIITILINEILMNTPMLISILCIFIGSFLYSINFPILFIMINDCNSDEEKNIMLGLRNIFDIIGYATSAIIGGLIAYYFSLRMVMLLIPVLLLWTSFHMFLTKNIFLEEYVSTQEK